MPQTNLSFTQTSNRYTGYARGQQADALPGAARASHRLKTNRKIISGATLSLFAELIEFESQIDVLLELEKRCFPDRMQAHAEDFRKFLSDKLSAGLILYKDAEPIGYVTGFHIDPVNSARAIESSEFIRRNEERIFYVSSLAIVKEHRSLIALGFLVKEMADLLKSIGYDFFTAYVRKRNGLTRLLNQRLGCRMLHTQENWENTGEAFDYCLVDLHSLPSYPPLVDHIWHLLRLVRRRLKGIPKRTA